jgi:MscS family membrane protein
LLGRTAGLDNWQWLGLALIAGLGVLVAQLLTWLTITMVRFGFRRARLPIEAHRERRFVRPVWLTCLSLTWLAGVAALDLSQKVHEVLNTGILIMVTLGGVGTAYHVTGLVGSYFHRRARRTAATYADEIVVSLVTTVAQGVVVLIGILLLAEGLKVPLQGVLAGLGISGFAFALAARETLANFFGAAVLLVDRPFRRGDWIVVGDQQGTVEEVGIRATRLRAQDDSVLVIPNGTLATAQIANLGRRRNRLIKMRIALRYDTPPASLESFTTRLRQLVLAQPKMLRDKLQVGVWEFAEAAIELELICYLQVTSADQEREARHRLLLDIVRLAEEEGVRFALPAPTIQVAPPPTEAITERPRLAAS